MQVSPFSFPPAFVGVGYGMPAPGMGPIKTDPTKEYVAGGYGFLQRNIPQVLPWMVDDITRELGPEVYDAMDTDAVVGATFRLWKMQVLANDVQILPALRPSEDRLADAERTSWTPDELLAQEIADFCDRSTRRCATPIKTVFSQLLDAAKAGNKIAEILCEPGLDGTDDAEKVVLKDLKVKPRWAWLFVADVFLSLVGILAFDPQEGGFVIVPLDKFVRVTWQMRDNDPRGTSVFRGPYRPWNIKQLIYPEWYAHLVQFGRPTVVGFTAPEDETNNHVQIDEKGNPLKDQPLVTAQVAMGQALAAWRNGYYAVFPAGAQVQVEWPEGAGEPFLKAIDVLDRQIVYGVLGSIRDSLEAKHGSKADGEVSQDKTSNVIRAGREMIQDAYRQCALKYLVTANYGAVIAEKFTPYVSLGTVEHQDVVALMGGVAKLLAAGGIDRRSQLAAIHAKLDLPPAAPGAFDDDDPDPDDPAAGDDEDDDQDDEKEERRAA